MLLLTLMRAELSQSGVPLKSLPIVCMRCLLLLGLWKLNRTAPELKAEAAAARAKKDKAYKRRDVTGFSMD